MTYDRSYVMIMMHCSSFESVCFHWLKRESLGQQRRPLNVCELMKNEWITAELQVSAWATWLYPHRICPPVKEHEKREGPFEASQNIRSKSRGGNFNIKPHWTSRRKTGAAKCLFIVSDPQTTPQGSTHISRHIIFYSSPWQLMSPSLGSDYRGVCLHFLVIKKSKK